MRTVRVFIAQKFREPRGISIRAYSATTVLTRFLMIDLIMFNQLFVYRTNYLSNSPVYCDADLCTASGLIGYFYYPLLLFFGSSL